MFWIVIIILNIARKIPHASEGLHIKQASLD